MTGRQIAQKAPYSVDVEARRTYYWCACGQSKKQPFCYGSQRDRHHTGCVEGGEDRPILFLRLQTVEKRTALRWQPRQAVTHYVETRPVRAALAERNPAARIALSRMLDTHNTSGSRLVSPPAVNARAAPNDAIFGTILISVSG